MFGLQHLRDAAQVVLVPLLCAGLVEGDANDTLCNVVQVKFRSLRHHDSVPSWEEICREDETGFSSVMCRLFESICFGM